ncbi:acyl-CoA thioesterase [Streptomyces daliensis]|uniref:Acyl-CoA thioesterase n=1 Tax=Streptomyces daliensis TaxID=299421 RepID=A0A8T4IJW2_9ACTN|nr:acyl-CoA thioesterase [Streptomyces daliensis]
MRHTYQCPLRWSDMDAFGHVNNVVFLRYLEEARIDFMFRLAREAASSAETDAGEGEGDQAGEVAPFTGGTVVARHEIDYLRPLVHRHTPVTIETWVTKISAASTTVAYEVKDADTVYVRAQTIVVPYNLEKERPRRLTAAEKGFLEGYFDDSAAAAAGIR